MATSTFGTAATNTLTSLVFQKSDAAADIATIQNAIANDKINGFPTFPGAFGLNGLLYIPNRGVVKVFEGDYVAIEPSTGWPILISGAAASTASFIHT